MLDNIGYRTNLPLYSLRDIVLPDKMVFKMCFLGEASGTEMALVWPLDLGCMTGINMVGQLDFTSSGLVGAAGTAIYHPSRSTIFTVVLCASSCHNLKLRGSYYLIQFYTLRHGISQVVKSVFILKF